MTENDIAFVLTIAYDIVVINYFFMSWNVSIYLPCLLGLIVGFILSLLWGLMNISDLILFITID